MHTAPITRRPAVTIADIARQAGVSRQTAGYIINGQDRLFRPDTVARVMEACRSLGYRPNAGARAMRTGRFDAVGFCASSHGWLTNVSEGLLGGIHDRLAARDWHLVYARLPEGGTARRDPVPRVLKHMMVDGLLISYTHNIPAPLLRLIHAGPTPTISINSQLEANCVLPDDHDAGRRATDRLIRMGHRRIAFAAFNVPDRAASHTAGHFSLRARYQGYLAAMRAADLPPRRLPSLARGRTIEHPAIDTTFLRRADAPTAIVSYSRYGIDDVLVTARLQRPRHVPAVSVFEDTPAWSDGRPLDTWIVPWRTIGGLAVDLLLQRIAAAGAPLPARLVPFECIAAKAPQGRERRPGPELRVNAAARSSASRRSARPG